MRIKDSDKQDALFEATVKLVNEIGFAASSVSKIAKEAGISPATIYIYHKNKEDLLVSIYIEIKRKMSEALLTDFDEQLPIRDIFQRVWMNTFQFISRYPEYHQFAEQFNSSPYSELVNKAEVEGYFMPLLNVLQRGIDQKILKDVGFDMLAAFMFFPVLILSNPRICKSFEATPENMERAFTLAWDAVKL